MKLQAVDGYCHCGLRKYHPIEDVKRVMDRFGVGRAVLVQHLGEYDNSYIERIVADQPDRFVGVLLVDVQSPGAQEDLRRWAASRGFRGIRLVARTLAARRDVWDLAADLGLNIMVYDEPTIAAHADRLANFARTHPDTRLVLSHFGMLDRQEAPGFDSHRRILQLADVPNFFLQISGMHMFAAWPYRELVPMAARCLEAFGAARTLYGSNYPVMKDDAVYGRELELLLIGRLGVPPDAVEQVVRRTAMNLWFDEPSLT